MDMNNVYMYGELISIVKRCLEERGEAKRILRMSMGNENFKSLMQNIERSQDYKQDEKLGE